MTEERQHQSLVISTKKGVPVCAKNPSVPNPDDIRRRKPVRFGDDKRGFIVDGGNGDVVGVGGMNFYEFEEVDNAKFVRMILAGIKQAAGLSKAGLSVFELVYTFIQENPNTDRVELSFYGASQQIKGLLERTYQRGLRELLDREFLFRSPVDGVFFVNIRYHYCPTRFIANSTGYRRGAFLDPRGCQKTAELKGFSQKASRSELAASYAATNPASAACGQSRPARKC